MKNRDWKPDWSDYNVDKFVILHDGEDDVFSSQQLDVVESYIDLTSL